MLARLPSFTLHPRVSSLSKPRYGKHKSRDRIWIMYPDNEHACQCKFKFICQQDFSKSHNFQKKCVDRKSDFAAFLPPDRGVYFDFLNHCKIGTFLLFLKN